MWRVEEHTADVRLGLHAADWPALVREAARCFGAYVGGAQPADDAGGPSAPADEVLLEGGDVSELWVRWWRALLRLWTVERKLAVDADVAADAPAGRLRATPRVVAADGLDLARCVDVKAVTWHAAQAGPAPGGGWRGAIVLDV